MPTGVTAPSSVSPVRMRTTRSSGTTKILPSPTSPVCPPSQSASIVGCDELVGDRDLEADLLGRAPSARACRGRSRRGRARRRGPARGSARCRAPRRGTAPRARRWPCPAGRCRSRASCAVRLPSIAWCSAGGSPSAPSAALSRWTKIGSRLWPGCTRIGSGRLARVSGAAAARPCFSRPPGRSDGLGSRQAGSRSIVNLRGLGLQGRAIHFTAPEGPVHPFGRPAREIATMIRRSRRSAVAATCATTALAALTFAPSAMAGKPAPPADRRPRAPTATAYSGEAQVVDADLQRAARHDRGARRHLEGRAAAGDGRLRPRVAPRRRRRRDRCSGSARTSRARAPRAPATAATPRRPSRTSTSASACTRRACCASQASVLRSSAVAKCGAAGHRALRRARTSSSSRSPCSTRSSRTSP